MERISRPSARPRARWLLAGLAGVLTIPLVSSAAGAVETDQCAYGYTSEASVFFGVGAGESDVPNYDTGDGCTVMDEIMSGAPFTNHGQFVSTVGSVTRTLVRDDVLTQAERSDVLDAAARSEVGKPHPVTGTRSVDLSKIGLVGFTVRATMPTDAVGTLDALATCGFQNIEPSGRAGNFYGYTAETLAPLTDAAGLSVPSLGVSQDNLENDLDLVISEAHAIGAKYVRISGSSSWTLEDYSETAAILNEVGAKLQDEGITVAYHNHGYEFETVEDGITGYDVLVRETDPELVTMELDVYWAASVGAHAVDLFQTYPGRFELLHLKDLAADGSFADVGEGTIDFAEIFAHAKLAGVEYGFTEHDRPVPDGVTSACRSIGNLAELRY
ncbi:sugar phosphate isomerase/epimerase family protein [Georgenia subflava]|uniref:TIM barrel protein n=1 Tax=Georgenia subflava TaxID=1622177 RepID=A0A6N7ECX9_9MICO|nr:sugar phosphate isomerase/epimerase [Georgenia subflava]MPV35830.1 TIM barrel protein [Georgenia subflava]